MADLRRVVLDVLKPHEPPLVEFAERLADVEDVDGATASLLERDREVQNVEITVEGQTLDFEAVEESIADLGATVHSVDQVAYGENVVERRRTRDD